MILNQSSSSVSIPPVYSFNMGLVANSHHLTTLISTSLLSQATPLEHNMGGLSEKTVSSKPEPNSPMLPLTPLPLPWGNSSNQVGTLATEVPAVETSSPTSITWSEQSSPASSSSSLSSSSSSSTSFSIPVSPSTRTLSSNQGRSSIKERSKKMSVEELNREKDLQAIKRHYEKKQEYLEKKVENLEKICAELLSRNKDLLSLNGEFLSMSEKTNSINTKLIQLLARNSGLTYQGHHSVINFGISNFQRL